MRQRAGAAEPGLVADPDFDLAAQDVHALVPIVGMRRRPQAGPALLDEQFVAARFVARREHLHLLAEHAISRRPVLLGKNESHCGHWVLHDCTTDYTPVAAVSDAGIRQKEL